MELKHHFVKRFINTGYSIVTHILIGITNQKKVPKIIY